MTTSSFTAYKSINYTAFSVQIILSVKKFTEKYKDGLSPLKLAIYLYSLSGEISVSFVVKLHMCMSACGLMCMWVSTSATAWSSFQSSLSTHHLR